MTEAEADMAAEDPAAEGVTETAETAEAEADIADREAAGHEETKPLLEVTAQYKGSGNFSST